MAAINGFVIGIVREVRPGSVRVNYPWLADDHLTDWVRIATAMSGGERGTCFMPEVGDEALLGFNQSDARLPYVVGFLWNGKDEPPVTDVRDRCIASVRHTIRFLDATPSEGSVGALVIEDGHKNRIVMSSNKITIDAPGMLEINALAVTINGRLVSGLANPI